MVGSRGASRGLASVESVRATPCTNAIGSANTVASVNGPRGGAPIIGLDAVPRQNIAARTFSGGNAGTGTSAPTGQWRFATIFTCGTAPGALTHATTTS